MEDSFIMLAQAQKSVNTENRHRRVKAALALKGKKFIDIADELEVTPGCVNNVIKGHYHIDRIAKGVATFVGIPYEELWPTKPTEGK